jgi:hypothetical protein
MYFYEYYEFREQLQYMCVLLFSFCYIPKARVYII